MKLVPAFRAAVLAFSVVAVALAGCSNPEQTTDRFAAHGGDATGAPAVVSEVVDGDTVIVKVGGQTESVRLIGIDTPEVPGGVLPAECYGDEASAFTRSLLPEGTEVRLTRDTEPRDRYGRLLAYIHREADGLFVNLEIAAAGYADVLIIEPNVIHALAFAGAVATARNQQRGLWPACGSADNALQ